MQQKPTTDLFISRLNAQMACFVPYRPDPHRRMPWTCPRFRGEKCYRTFSATAMWESWWCALVNTDEVASATQHADAGPCASCGTERPVAIAGATQSSEERIRTTEEQHAEVDGMRDFRRCHRQVCIVATLPGALTMNRA